LGLQAAVPPATAPQAQAAWVNRSEAFSMEIKALVTDSSSKARKNITRSLKEIGVRDVVEATNGNEAVKLMEKDKFDVVIAEWNTQIGQGEELVKSFRRTDAKMPVIVTAPQSKQIDELKKTYPTASNYLSIPFTTEQLQKTVAQCVPSIAG
jgi:two-component system chemotaxis response regulator CheY